MFRVSRRSEHGAKFWFRNTFTFPTLLLCSIGRKRNWAGNENQTLCTSYEFLTFKPYLSLDGRTRIGTSKSKRKSTTLQWRKNETNRRKLTSEIKVYYSILSLLRFLIHFRIPVKLINKYKAIAHEHTNNKQRNYDAPHFCWKPVINEQVNTTVKWIQVRT